MYNYYGYRATDINTHSTNETTACHYQPLRDNSLQLLVQYIQSTWKSLQQREVINKYTSYSTNDNNSHNTQCSMMIVKMISLQASVICLPSSSPSLQGDHTM